MLYNAAGQPVATIDPLMHRTTTIYDAAGRPVAEIDSLGDRTTSVYDKNRVVASIDGNGNRTTTIFDAVGSPVATINALGLRTTTVYDSIGQTSALIDELGHRFSFTYDAAGSKIAQIDPLNRRQTMSYNAVGRQETRLDARGNLTTYVYDGNRNLLGRQYPDGSRVTFSYNVLGDRTMMANQTGRYTTTYDQLNRRRTVTTPARQVLTYSYDSLSRRTELDSSAGPFTYSYDANNRITLVRNPQQDRTSFTYDDASRRTVKKLANGTRASFTYDAANQMTRMANLKSDGTTISSFAYKYDHAGNRTEIAEADGSRVTYSYDANYRLTGEYRTGTSAYRNTYSYDPTSNRLVKNDDGARTTYTYDAANQLVTGIDSSGTTFYTFDSDGNQQLVIAPNGDRTTTTWDFENKTTLIELPTGTRNTMAYDPDGLRVQLDDSSGTTNFIWDDQNYLIETDNSDAITAAYTNEPQLYGNLLSQYRKTNGLWLPSYYHFDALGSTRELTDGSETVTDTYLYNAWGELLASSGTTVNPFTWIGQVGYSRDPDTGLYYVRARILQPQTARWTSVDPYAFIDALNYYVYGDNLPTMMIDASGAQTQTEPEPPNAPSCTFDVCSSPVAGGAAGHLFIICGGNRYRTGPGRNPDDPPDQGRGKPDCDCRTKGRGQVVGDVDPWDEKPLDHPGNAQHPYDPRDLKCITLTAPGVGCDSFCGCLGRVTDAIEACCIPYTPVPPALGNSGNSNSSVGWMLKLCAPPTGALINIIPLPGGIRPNPGANKPIPKCVKTEVTTQK